MPCSSIADAPAELYAAAYQELLHIARRERRKLRASATVNTTALVHETYLKLRAQAAAAQLDQGQFLAIAARAMRQVLIDHARRSNARKRQHLTVTIDHAESVSQPTTDIDILALDAALQRLEAIDPQLARIVDLHVFSGLEFHEIALIEGVPERSLFRLWRNARVFLLTELAA